MWIEIGMWIDDSSNSSKSDQFGLHSAIIEIVDNLDKRPPSIFKSFLCILYNFVISYLYILLIY